MREAKPSIEGAEEKSPRAVLRRFGWRFVVSMALLFVTLELMATSAAVAWVNDSTAVVAARIADGIGLKGVSSDDGAIRTSGGSLVLANGCNGLDAIAILIAGVLAFPARVRARCVGLLGGTTLVLVVNQIRVVSLIATAQDTPTFEFLHVRFWQSAIVVFVGLVWYAWIRWVFARGAVRV